MVRCSPSKDFLWNENSLRKCIRAFRWSKFLATMSMRVCRSLITAIGFKIRFGVQVSGTQFDCFVIRRLPQQTWKKHISAAIGARFDVSKLQKLVNRHGCLPSGFLRIKGAPNNAGDRSCREQAVK
jgi:hypothetical protein